MKTDPDDGSLAPVETTLQALSAEFAYHWGDGKPFSSLDEYRREALKKDQAALCLSGGGVRSAAFALGVVQALARKGLLRHFHYLSTVSGGGYTGAWLSRWLTEAKRNIPLVEAQLAGRAASELAAPNAVGRDKSPLPEHGDPAPVRWLREYSNFITPSTGLFSMDTWAALAIVVRNLVLNWLIFAPALLLAVTAPNLYATGFEAVSGDGANIILLIGFGLVAFAAWRGCYDLPSHARQVNGRPIVGNGTQAARAAPVRPSGSGSSEKAAPSVASTRQDVEQPADESVETRRTGHQVFCFVALPSLLAALALPLGLAPALVGSLAPISPGGTLAWSVLGVPGRASAPWLVPAVATGAGVILALLVGYLLAWLTVPRETRRGFGRNLIVWSIGAILSGSAVMLGVRLGYGVSCNWGDAFPVHRACGLRADVLASAGPLWVVLSQIILTTFYTGFRQIPKPVNFSPDLDREWLARLSGQKARLAIAWAAFAAAALLLPRVVLEHGSAVVQWLSGPVTLAFGLFAAFGGKSARSGASSASRARSMPLDRLIGLATLLFALALAMFLSRADMHLAAQMTLSWSVTAPGGLWIALLALAVLYGTAVAVASSLIKVNRFSLNGLYRNRLSRAFLGAARRNRRADPFTGFDPRDNIRMHALAAQHDAPFGNPPGGRGLFHVVNVALNLVGGRRLAWQERKAESFTITPLASGSAELRSQDHGPPLGGYVSSYAYGGNEPDVGSGDCGISLATAVAISGAAASPSMGYHSSPATAFLMTLFNVRLGAWLPNPGRRDLTMRVMRRSSPTNALRPLIAEVAGLTNDRGRNVYLSDGGHFENLGLYEMIRRRCRFIVVSDAGCDPSCRFEDLGNAVRKIAIDHQGVDIQFKRIAIGARGVDIKDQFAFALGEIRYPEDETRPGQIIYIKPSYFGNMPIDVRAYAEANGAFPHETTADQWFSESQFESYRRLGYHLAGELGSPDASGATSYETSGLPQFFADAAKHLAGRVARQSG